MLLQQFQACPSIWLDQVREALNQELFLYQPSEANIRPTVQDEGLKALLMSWYYAGYYTGLYEGQQQAKSNPS
jgi:hypothetical protein